MAVHTPVPADALTDFLAGYGLPPADRFEGIAAGVENTNYRVDAGGRKLILTLYEGRTQTGDLPYFLGLTAHAAARGVPCPAPLAADGRVVGTLMDRPAALLTRLPGGTPDAPTRGQAHEAGRMLAGFHAAVSDYPGRRADPLGPGGWRRLAVSLEGAHEAGGEVRETADRLAERWPRNLPAGPIHADLFPDNVLYEGGAVSGLIDPYFACDGLLSYDLAVAMNAFAQEHPQGYDEARAASVRDGYESVRRLTPDEADALPFLRQGAALRFFLTRLEDTGRRTASSLVKVKEPLPYLMIARQQAGGGAKGGR